MNAPKQAIEPAVERLSRILADADLSKNAASQLAKRVSEISDANRRSLSAEVGRGVDGLLLTIHRLLGRELSASAAMHLANASILGIKRHVDEAANCYRAAEAFSNALVDATDESETLLRVREQRYVLDADERKVAIANARKTIARFELAERTQKHLLHRIAEIESLYASARAATKGRGGGGGPSELDLSLHAFETELDALENEDITGQDSALVALAPIIVIGSVAALTIGGVYYAATHGVFAATTELERLARTSPLEKWEIAEGVARYCGGLSPRNRTRVITNLRRIQIGPPALPPGPTNDHIESIIRYINRL